MSSSKDRRYTRIEVAKVSKGRVRPDGPSSRQWTGVTRGVLVQLSGECAPYVDFEGNPESKPLLASSTIVLREQDLGREAVLMFEDGDSCRPIILGLIQTGAPKTHGISAEVDSQKLELTAERQIVLRCGEARSP